MLLPTTWEKIKLPLLKNHELSLQNHDVIVSAEFCSGKRYMLLVPYVISSINDVSHVKLYVYVAQVIHRNSSRLPVLGLKLQF